jgi:uroporphyrinogen decarboxylase
MSDKPPKSEVVSPRQRVTCALSHADPDQTPVDFLATPEIWQRLVTALEIDSSPPKESDYFDPAWESLLRELQTDCRVLSYDQFCDPPQSILETGAEIDWWGSLARSTPNRMWRQRLPDGSLKDIWGHEFFLVDVPDGVQEEYRTWPLAQAQTLNDLKSYPWPEPDWWDFNTMPDVIAELDSSQEHHIRFRAGSIFELSWQLRGMEQFLVDMALGSPIPGYIMDRLTEVILENLRRVLGVAGNRLDMIYFYDDLASKESLLISPETWLKQIKPHHSAIIEVAKTYDKPVMYHCDGAIQPLIPALIDMGVDVLNPIEVGAKGMDPVNLKEAFGDRLCFHGGIDIRNTLPCGTTEDVQDEVRQRIEVLGRQGGYILASSHHIQPDTPLENIFAMYDVSLR